MPERVSDEELLSGIRSGQAVAFQALYERHAEAVYNVALRILGGAAQAADATQEVFLTLYQRAGTLREADRVRPWLLRIAVNLSIDWWRKGRGAPVSLERLAQPLPATAPVSDPVGQAMSRELEARLSRAVVQLSETLREVVVLRYVEDLSYLEIAELLEVPIGTVKSRIYRAHQALVEALPPVTT